MSYNPEHPTYIFTIGQLISFASICLAMLNLMHPLQKFRFYGKHKIIVISMAGFGILSVFVGNLLPMFNGGSIWLLGYPILWEAIGAVSLLVSIGYFLKIITTKRMLKVGQIESFYSDYKKSIINEKEDIVIKFLDEIEISLELIFLRIGKTKEKESNRKELQLERDEDKYCFGLLYILEDKRIIRTMCEHRNEVACKIILLLEKNKIPYISAVRIFNNIILSSVFESNSYLRRQNQVGGLSVISESIINTSIQCAHLMGENIHLYNAIKYESKKFDKISLEIISDYTQKIYPLLETGNMYYFDAVLSFVYFCEWMVNRNETLNSTLHEMDLENILIFLKSKSIDFEEISKPLVEYIEIDIRNNFDKFPSTFFSRQIIGLIVENDFQKNCPNLYHSMMESINHLIDNNLNENRMYFPSMIGILILLYGLDDSSNENSLSSHFKSEFKDKFPKIWTKNKEIAKQFLPKYVEYNEVEKIITINGIRSSKQYQL